jgi:NAD(P)-dependent dehydrogenase (short-subunit alcohol dehydrogenase family)
MDAKPLAGRVAIVTGAAQGIGRSIAERLVVEGGRVFILDVDGDAAKATAAELGHATAALAVDIADESAVEAGFGQVIAAAGRIDVLVNNAGILGSDAPVQHLEADDWDRVIGINLRGTFLCSRAAVRHMVPRAAGVIVSIASISGKEGNANMAPYSVSKAGIICFTKSLAKEMMAHGIRVNCVAPALIDSPLLAGMEQPRVAVLTSKIPMGRLGRPEEVAAMVLFLASDQSSFTTGQCFDMSGGRATY